MGLLKFRDNIMKMNEIPFDAIETGTAFEYDNRLFIKVTGKDAFDVINLTLRYFTPSAPVIEREAEIIFS